MLIVMKCYWCFKYTLCALFESLHLKRRVYLMPFGFLFIFTTSSSFSSSKRSFFMNSSSLASSLDTSLVKTCFGNML